MNIANVIAITPNARMLPKKNYYNHKKKEIGHLLKKIREIELVLTKVNIFWDESQDMSLSGFPPKKTRFW